MSAPITQEAAREMLAAHTPAATHKRGGSPKGTVPWNAGTSTGWTDKRGYRWLYVMENGRRRARREHRVLMERHLGRRLEPWEVVHHRDENPSNNSIDNLEVQEFGAHSAHHHTSARHTSDSKKRMEAFGVMREQLRHERSVNADMLAALKAHDAYMLDAGYSGPDAAALHPKAAENWRTARAAIQRAEGRS